MKSIVSLIKEVMYLAFLALIWLIRFLPYPLLVIFFRFLGIVYFLVDVFHRKVATIQIRCPWHSKPVVARAESIHESGSEPSGHDQVCIYER